jgi:hypothetical protein
MVAGMRRGSKECRSLQKSHTIPVEMIRRGNSNQAVCQDGNLRLSRMAQVQEPGCTRREAGGGGGMEQMIEDCEGAKFLSSHLNSTNKNIHAVPLHKAIMLAVNSAAGKSSCSFGSMKLLDVISLSRFSVRLH